MKKILVVLFCVSLLPACVAARAPKGAPTPSTTISSTTLPVESNSSSAKTEGAYQYTSDISQGTQPTSSINIYPVQTWELTTGSLYGQLDTWAGKAGYQLVWKSENDLQMMSSATFKGTFIEAIESLFGGLAKNGHSFTVTLYTANSVLEVKE